MLTGRYNYTAASERLGIDLVNNPDLAQTPEVSVMTAGDYWDSRNMNPMADGDKEDNIRRVTKAINGGYTHYNDRKAYFMAAGRIDWEEAGPPPVEPSEGARPAYVTEAFVNELADQVREQRENVTVVWNNPQERSG